jgi:formylglycine-generating enzyme required for sulfatase activity
MGSPDSEVGRGQDERPHRVRITKPFYLGMYEVTQQEYEQVMGTNPSNFANGGLDVGKVSGLNTRRFPVEEVNWEESEEFCEKLSQLPRERAAGRRYRLPTEAEWEYACRADTTTAFSFGAQLNARDANRWTTNNTTVDALFLGRPAQVGSYSPNAFGLYDMHGNAHEWCADWYGKDYYESSQAADPQGPAAGSFRVIRGGGWGSAPVRCRSAHRGAEAPTHCDHEVGFRVVCLR